jgi:hypothetical protein
MALLPLPGASSPAAGLLISHCHLGPVARPPCSSLRQQQRTALARSHLSTCGTHCCRVYFWEPHAADVGPGEAACGSFKYYSPPLRAKDFKQGVGDFTASAFIPGTSQAVTGTRLQRWLHAWLGAGTGTWWACHAGWELVACDDVARCACAGWLYLFLGLGCQQEASTSTHWHRLCHGWSMHMY